MKKKSLIVACCFVSILSCKKSSAPATPPPVSDIHLSNGLLVYLPFNGTWADSSGNGNTTSAVGGAALTTDEHGKASSAFGGTGIGGRLLVTNNGSIKFDTAFTVSADVMVTTVQDEAFVAMVDNTNGQGVSFGFGINGPTQNDIEMSVTDSLSTCGVLNNAGNTLSDISNFVMQTGVWYNMLTTFHKGTVQIYANGILVSSQSWAGTFVPICSSAKLIIGGWWDGDTQSINGSIDNVRLYNRVLNADEIAQIANNFQ